MFPEATLHFINILPRTDRKRMNVINQINEFIPSLSKHVTKFVHIDTYYNKMFCDHNGRRRANLFKTSGTNDVDNVHLNFRGYTRLGAHLKYLSHNSQLITSSVRLFKNSR